MFEQIPRIDLNKVKKEKEVLCAICFKNHEAGKCAEIENLSALPDDQKKEIINRVRSVIRKSGAAGLGEEAMQKTLSQLSRDKENFQNVINDIIFRHKLGSFREIESNGKKEKIFTGAEFITDSGKIKINKNPIGFDKDFNQYVLRHNLIRDDGSLDPAVRISTLSSAISLETKEKKLAA